MYPGNPRIRLILSLTILLALIFLAAPTLTAAQDEPADPAKLLDNAAQAMLALDSFHFEISTPVGATMISDQVELAGVQGDVVRPDAFQATFTVELGFVSLDLKAIGIGSDLWVADPTSGDNRYVQVAGEGEETLPPQLLLNPDQLVLQAVHLLRDPAIVGSDEIDGVRATAVGGTFDPQNLVAAGTPIPEELLSTLDPLAVTFWIDGENHIIRAEFAGPLLPSEQDAGRIVRRVDLSAFDEPVTIEAPEATA